MFVKELGKKAGVPSVYTLPFCMLGQWKFTNTWKTYVRLLALPLVLQVKNSSNVIKQNPQTIVPEDMPGYG
jgi:hypothetical protein